MTRSLFSLLLLCAAPAAHSQNLSLASREARSGPEWLNQSTIYQLWMRAFTPEATLKATAGKLRYIADLGATIVYLSPLQEHSLAGGAAKGWTMGGPYGMKDYARIDPGYGTEQELKSLTAQAHKLDLKVIMDVVFYHMAIDNQLVKLPGYAMRDKDGKLILGNWGRPRPDFANPKVREYFVNNLVHWVRDAGVDGFRCDVAAGVPLSFWEEARAALDRVNRDTILVAESEMPAQQLKAFDISYNFSYLKQTLQPILSEGEPAIRIRENWEKQKALWPRGSRLIYSSDNHDQERATRLFGEKAAYAANVLSFTLDGIPFLYNGQEIGDTTPTNYPEQRPIHWELEERSGWAHQQQATLARYRRLFAIRKQNPSLTSGSLTWVNNSAPESLVTFLRMKGDEQILVIVNLSNRKVSVTVDIAAADFMPATELLTGKRVTSAFSPGHISFPTPTGAFETMVLRRLPPQIAQRPRP
jgi:glycosidase